MGDSFLFLAEIDIRDIEIEVKSKPLLLEKRAKTKRIYSPNRSSRFLAHL